MARPHNSGSTLSFFFFFFLKFCTMKEAIRHSDFCKKDLVGCEWIIVDGKMLCSENSRSALKDLFIIYTMKEVKRHMKIK